MEKNSLEDWIEAILSKIGLGSAYRKNKKISNLEKRIGEVDFNGHISQEELGFKENRGNDYTPSPDYLLDLCRDRITASDIIMDIGCGKGYAMYLMSQFPFKKIYGIDLSEKLVKIANENIKIIGESHRCKVWAIDAAKIDEDEEVWEALKSSNYIYIYNSVPKNVMERVVEELEMLCSTYNWSATIWYVSPSTECLEVIEKSVRFAFVKRYFDKERAGGVYEFVSMPS